MLRLLKRYSYLLVILLLVGMMIFGAKVNYTNKQRQVNELSNKITELEKAITLGNAELENVREELVEKTGAYSWRRHRQDDTAVENYLKDLFSWDSYASYTKARDAIVNSGLAKHSSDLDNYPFVDLFFPEVFSTTDKAGNVYNQIDMYDLRMSYDEMESIVTNVSEDGTYSYITFVTWHTTSDGDSKYIGKQSGTDIVTYDVNADGVISNLDGVVTDEY